MIHDRLLWLAASLALLGSTALAQDVPSSAKTPPRGLCMPQPQHVADDKILSDVDLKALPFHFALQRLREMSGLKISLDPATPSFSELKLDQPVTLKAESISAVSAVEALARQLDPDLTVYSWGDEITISTERSGERFMEVRVYDVKALLPDGLTDAQQEAINVAVARVALFDKDNSAVETAKEDLEKPAEVVQPCFGSSKVTFAGESLRASLIHHVAAALESNAADALRALVEDTVAPTTWDAYGGKAKIRIYDRMLVVRTWSPYHNDVAALLEQLKECRSARDHQPTVESEK